MLQAVLTTDSLVTLGKRGDLVSVQNGYMTNFLVPKKMAKPATKEILACASSYLLSKWHQCL
jgi:large subunit ribosomal protein L9